MSTDISTQSNELPEYLKNLAIPAGQNKVVEALSQYVKTPVLCAVRKDSEYLKQYATVCKEGDLILRRNGQEPIVLGKPGEQFKAHIVYQWHAYQAVYIRTQKEGSLAPKDFKGFIRETTCDEKSELGRKVVDPKNFGVEFEDPSLPTKDGTPSRWKYRKVLYWALVVHHDGKWHDCFLNHSAGDFRFGRQLAETLARRCRLPGDQTLPIYVPGWSIRSEIFKGPVKGDWYSVGFNNDGFMPEELAAQCQELYTTLEQAYADEKLPGFAWDHADEETPGTEQDNVSSQF